MVTSALNFVAVCANANLPVQGNKNQFFKVLKESGASIGSSQSLPDIKERFAALTWVRHAVANAIDPASWPSTLSAPLLDFLRSLYPIPPPRSDAPAGETDLHRLANIMAWSPCSSRPTCLLLSLPLRPLRRLLRVAASTLRARRPLSKPRRIRPQGPPLRSQLRRSSTSPERSAG